MFELELSGRKGERRILGRGYSKVGRSLETSRIRMLVQSGRKGEARVARTCSSLRTWSLPGERGGATREPLPAKGRQDRVGYEKNTIIE